MFRQMVAPPPGTLTAQQVLDLHPMVISRLAEEAWATTTIQPAAIRPTGPLEIPALLRDQERVPTAGAGWPSAPSAWDHLIYAYMIENTRAYEVFGRVLEEFAHGERFGIASQETMPWIRTTEALFYADSAPLQIYSITSSIRPDIRASRRNAYLRMFGMDLNHGGEQGRPYPYRRAQRSNTEFVAVLEDFLREAWIGVVNRSNTSGARPTDDAAIANLGRLLQSMLIGRRLNGNLFREELMAVMTLGWLDVTLSFDSPIVRDLAAEAPTPEERLLKIADRVGLPAHSRSGAYFRLARSTSTLLRELENGNFTTLATAPLLYNTPLYQSLFTDIVRDWTIATGRDLKAARVSVGGHPPTPPPPFAGPTGGPTGPNGNGRTTPADSRR